MTQYLISFGAHAMDHIPGEDMPAVAKAAHAVVQEAINAGVLCGRWLGTWPFQTGRLTSPWRICLAEHLVELGVGPHRADFLRAAAGGCDLGSPLQRLLV